MGKYVLKIDQVDYLCGKLGGTESFITYPATQTHMDIPEAERVARGITNTLLRFSVGLEECGRHQSRFITGICTA